METETSVLEYPFVPKCDDTEERLQKRRENRNGRIRMALGLFLPSFLAFVISDSLTNKYLRTGIRDFLEWVQDNPGGGVVAFIMVVFGTTMLFIPGIILTFGSGYVFSNAFGLGVGVLLAVIAVFVGASAGAIVSFLLGRFLLRGCVVGLTKKFKTFEALDRAMAEKGLRIMLLLRLSPIIFASPYLNYGAGGTAISFWAYSVSLLAMLPASVIFVFLGASTGSLADGSGSGDSKMSSIMLVFGIVVSVIAIGLTSFYVRQELNKIAADAPSDERQNATEANEDNDEETGSPNSPPANPSNQ
jgi:uncharacterized membrane protein YdjX (TVP38/TMEM64 family)